MAQKRRKGKCYTSMNQLNNISVIDFDICLFSHWPNLFTAHHSVILVLFIYCYNILA